MYGFLSIWPRMTRYVPLAARPFVMIFTCRVPISVLLVSVAISDLRFDGSVPTNVTSFRSLDMEYQLHSRPGERNVQEVLLLHSLC